MKKLSTPQLALLGLLTAFALGTSSGCNKLGGGSQTDTVIKIKQAPGEPLAKVGKVTLTLEEMRQDFLERQGTFRGAPHLNTEKKRSEYIENQVMQEAMFQEAIGLGYFDDPEVKRNVKKFVVQKLMRDKLAAAQDSYVPTEEEMKEYYDKNPVHFNREEAIKVAYLAIPFEGNAKKAKSTAETLHKDATNKVKNANTKEFARLAISFAQSPTAGSGKIETNETEYLEKEAFEAKFGKDSFAMVRDMDNPGQIAPMLTTENSYFVIMKTGQRKKLNESFEDSKPKIAKRISFEKRGTVYEKYLAELRQKYNITIEQARVADLSKDPDPKPATAAKEETR